MTDGLSPDGVFDLGLGFLGSKALLTAVELGVFAELADGPLDRATLVERLGVDGRGAADFFDSLVALGALERADGVYRLAPGADSYLDPTSDTYVGSFLAFANARIYRAWTGLGEALRTGEPQAPGREETREDAYDDLFEDEARLAFFLEAMSGLSALSARAVAERFPWDEYDSLCDLGTSKGKLPIEVARRHDHLAATGLDLPPVERFFAENVADHGLADRVGFVAGNFFEDPLPDADVYVLGHVLHNWGDEKKRALLTTVHEALPDDGAVVVYGTIIDDDRRENALALLMSLNMAVTMDDGRGYTFAECEDWLRDVGFARTRRADLPGPDSMLVAEK